MTNSLSHYGIKGMRWGIRRTPEQLGRRAEKKDAKWVTKGKGAKITAQVRKAVSKDMDLYELSLWERGEVLTSSGKLSKTFINKYNQRLAQVMNEKVGDIAAPSGRVIRYVAKRGELGVHTALADQGYNMNQVAKGVHASGRIAYRQEMIRKT